MIQLVMFWKSVNKLGIKNERKQTIPWEILTYDGEAINDKDAVLNRWKNDFEKLYQGSNDG